MDNRDQAGERATVRDRNNAQQREGTTGQSARDRDAQPARNRDAQRPADPARSRQDRAAQPERSGGGISLSGEQRQRVSARFAARIDSMNVRPIPRSRLSVSIGVAVPRSIRVHVVPREIVAIYPRFRGHSFVLVEDEIVILEPGSRRIVAVLPHSGDGQAGRSTATTTTGSAAAGTRLRLSTEERQRIRTIVLREPACRFEQRFDFFIGIPLPRTVRVCEFPQEVLADVPDIRPYRFMVREDEVVIVDPADERRVVEILD